MNRVTSSRAVCFSRGGLDWTHYFEVSETGITIRAADFCAYKGGARGVRFMRRCT